MKHLKIHIAVLIGLAVFSFTQCKPDDKGNTQPTSFGTPQPITPPAGFPAMNIPADNPQTMEGVELGRHLFYDKKLSADLTLSCASCHDQFRAFSDVDQFSTGVDGKVGRRQAMALFNLVFQEEFFWDGRAKSLEEQSIHPIIDPVELANDLPTVIRRLEADSAYPAMFKAAFGDTKVTEERIGKAIAQFERTMISANSEFDKVKRISGDIDAPFIEDPSTPGSKNNGYLIFSTERGDCFHCHSVDADGAYLGGGFGMDLQFVNNGLKMDYSNDEGRKEVTGKPSDWGKFKVPSVRNVARSFPYMHDGSIPNLDSLIGFYNFGGFDNGNTDANMKFAGDDKGTRNFTEQEILDLKEFLNTLTDWDFIQDPRFSDPFEN